MIQGEPKLEQTSGWDNAAVYQIYPNTFHEDSERDPQTGIGSIRGITEKLDYIKDTGFDAIWLSPFYVSPEYDGGYDVADMTDVNPELGTLHDMDELIAAAHERDIKVMVDYIPNHTSNVHAWFLQSRQSRDNEKSDWYIWADAVYDAAGNRQPPNNWASVFSWPQLERRQDGEISGLQPEDATPPVPAWTWDHEREQYYLHSFAYFQPDLNWANPAVRAAMKDTMRFWLDRGIDGFRVDAVNYIGKNITWDENGRLIAPDEEQNTAYREGHDNPYDQLQRCNSCGYPPTFYAYLHEITAVLDEPDYHQRDTRMIFEAYMNDHELRQINEVDAAHASTFNFGALDRPWEAESRKLHLDYYYHSLTSGMIANHVNGNHDKPRLATRLGADAARAAAVYTLLLPGMTFTYNGEELGLADGDVPADRLKDPNGLRDPARTPIPWDDTQPNAGFSGAPETALYLPINTNDLEKSVRQQLSDSLSSLALYQAAIALSHEHAGDYVPLRALDSVGEHDYDVVAYGRNSEQSQMTVLVNFSSLEQTTRLFDRERQLGTIALSSRSVCERQGETVDLSAGVRLLPNEALAILHAAI